MPSPPVAGYDYTKLPSNLTRDAVRKAYPPELHETLRALFNKASELVEAHDLGSQSVAGEKGKKTALKARREESAGTLFLQFAPSLEVDGFPAFFSQVCKGVILYQGGPGRKTKASDRPVSSSATPGPPTFSQTSIVPASSPEPLGTSQPTPPPYLDFQFHCRPSRDSLATPPIMVLASQLYTLPLNQQDLSLAQMIMEPLIAYLERRHTLSDPKNQCLRYKISTGTFALQDDDDLRNAVSYARNAHRNYLLIFVQSQDELEQGQIQLPQASHQKIPANITPPKLHGTLSLRSRTVPSGANTQGPQSQLHGALLLENHPHGAAKSGRSLVQTHQAAQSLREIARQSKSSNALGQSAKSSHGVDQAAKSLNPLGQSAKSLHGVSQSAKSLPGVDQSAKSLHGVSQSAKSLHGVDQSAKSLHGVDQSAKSLHGVSQSAKSLHGVDQSAKSSYKPSQPPDSRSRRGSQKSRASSKRTHSPSENDSDLELVRTRGKRRRRPTRVVDPSESESEDLSVDNNIQEAPDGYVPQYVEDDHGSENPDLDARLLATADSQLCEHIHNKEWEASAKFIGINPKSTSADAKWLLPGMKKPLFHWQWHAVFILALMNTGQNDLFGGLLGDDMGLGKTFIGIAVAVFRYQLWVRWQEIEDARRCQVWPLRHCLRDAPSGQTCPSIGSKSEWFACCPCEPGSPFHTHRPTNGPTFFLVPTSNLLHWWATLQDIVDLKHLGITTVAAHSAVPGSGFTSAITDRLRTTRSPEFRITNKTRVISPEHHGMPSPDSTSVWIVTTWHSWASRVAAPFQETHQYKTTVKGKKETQSLQIYRLHAGLFILDEIHDTRNKRVGPWKFLGQMLNARPDLRFWMVGMSGTLINSNPTDILAAIDIIGSKSWEDKQHPYHDLTPASLTTMKKALEKRQVAGQDASPETVDAADLAIKTFAQKLYMVLIRRHEETRWFGERLQELPPLTTYIYSVGFPDDFVGPYADMTTTWQNRGMASLRKSQQHWDNNQHNRSYVNAHPTRPTTLASGMIFSKARMLRVASNLPYLAKLISSGNYGSTNPNFKWTNAVVNKECEGPNGLLKPGCFLDQHYDAIVSSSPKIQAIGKLLKKHKGQPVVIMSSFSETTLIIEKYLRDHPTLGRKTRMYYGTARKREEAKDAFQLKEDDNGNLLYDDQPDTLIGVAGILGVGINLQRGIVVIMCEPVYDAKLAKQIPKRCHRQGQTEPVTYYVLHAQTMIEITVDEKRKNKSGFTADAFQHVNISGKNDEGYDDDGEENHHDNAKVTIDSF